MDGLPLKGLLEGRPSDSANDVWNPEGSPAARASPQQRSAGDCREAAAREAQHRAAWLAQTIEAQIIPRLLVAHRGDHDPDVAFGDRVLPGPLEVADLVDMALCDDSSAVRSYVETIRSLGVAQDVIYLQLLAPAARRLGAMWEEDMCDFTQVTLGLWRLQQVVYDFSPSFLPPDALDTNPRRALLAPVPGSQHTFGVLLVSEFFRRAGWLVWGEPDLTLPRMCETVRMKWFDVIGLSLGSECHVEQLTSAILTLRKQSLNSNVIVMIGGPVVLVRPEIVALVGADATASDAEDAVAQATRLVPMQDRPS
jgi:MerR family transcriptional regulator, light-induced transcriptional regulator